MMQMLINNLKTCFEHLERIRLLAKEPLLWNFPVDDLPDIGNIRRFIVQILIAKFSLVHEPLKAECK